MFYRLGFNFISHRKTLHGVVWFVLAVVLCLFNDVLVKAMGTRLSFYQVGFLRLFIGTFMLIPILLLKGVGSLKTPHVVTHLFRGISLVLATCLWFSGIHQVPLTMVTVIGFSIPPFIVVFAHFFLNESIGFRRGVPTILGFLGIIYTMNIQYLDFQLHSLLLLIAAALYAGLDVINKSIANQETQLNMLFYSSAVGSLLLAPIAIYYWIMPNLFELLGLVCIGFCGNLILFCIVKAYQLADVSYLAPWHYVELILSITMGFLLFGEIPLIRTIVGATIVLFSICLLAISDSSEQLENVN